MPEGKGFVSVSSDKVVRLNDFKTTREVATVSARVRTLSVSADGRYLAGGSDAGSVFVWDMENDFEETIL